MKVEKSIGGATGCKSELCCKLCQVSHFRFFDFLETWSRSPGELREASRLKLYRKLRKIESTCKNCRAQNELMSFAQSSVKRHISMLRSGHRSGRFCPAAELFRKLSMMPRHTEELFESLIVANLSTVARNLKFHIFRSFFLFARSLVPLARRAQRSLEAETLQNVAQDRVDLQKMIAAQNELRSSTRCSPTPNFVTRRSGRCCGRFCLAPELTFKLSMTE